MTIAVRPQSNGGANLGSAEQRWATTNTQNLDVSANALVGGNLEVTGNLVVNGTSATVNVETLSVEDPLIQVNKSNSNNLTDSGFYDQYVVDGTTKYSGIFRDASDNKFKAFVGLEAAPTTTVNTEDASYQTATLVASLQGNASTATALQDSVTLGVSGAVTGSASFDGSGNATIDTTIPMNSITNDRLQNPSISVTIKNDNGTTIDTSSVSLGGSVSFKEGSNVTLTKVGSDIVIATSGQLTGNADTATALATAQDFSITGGVISATAISFNGTGPVALSASIETGSVTNTMLANNSITINGQPTALGGSVTISNIGGNAATATTATTAERWTNSINITVTDGYPEDGWLQDTTVSFDGSSSETLTLLLNDAGITNVKLQNPYITIGADQGTDDHVELGQTLTIEGIDGVVTTVTENNLSIGIEDAGIANSKLANSSITIDGVTVDLGTSIDITSDANITVTPNAGASTINLALAGSINSSTTGNAATATKWADARTVTFASGDITGNFSIDGSANVDNVELQIGASTVDTTELADGAVTTNKIADLSVTNDKLANTNISVNTVSVALGGSFDILGTTNEIVVTDDGTNITIGLPDEITVSTVNANLVGNASTATALQTSRNIELQGTVSGLASFDGSANAVITTSIVDGTVANVKLVNSSIGIVIGEVADQIALGENLTLVAGNNITIEATNSNEVTISASGSFNGNAATASALETPRTITLGGNLSGSQSFNGSADITINATLANNTVGASHIIDGAVGTDELSEQSVTTAKIADDAITTEKIASSVAIETLNVTNALNISGVQVTSTASELNYVDINAAGTTQASKAWVSDSSNNITHGGNLVLDGTDKSIDINNGNLNVSGSVTAGNIEVTAAVGSISSTNLKIKDSLVELNFEGSAVSISRDIGIFGRLDPENNNNVVGLFYDGSDSIWKATYGATPSNSNYIGTITSYKPIMAQNFIPAGISIVNASTYTTTSAEDTVVITHNNNTTVTLHTDGSVGQKITIVSANTGGNNTIVNGAVVSITLAQNDSVTLVRANNAWYVVSKFVA